MTTPKHLNTLYLKAFFASAIIFHIQACASNLYSLPAPPPRSEWVTDASEPDAESREQNLRYLEARTAALKLFSALSTHNVKEATPLLAPETIQFITSNGEISLEEALKPLSKEEKASGERLDPVTEILSPDLSQISDQVPGIPEEEGPNRVEIFAKLKNGTFQRIILIRQADQWQVLRTSRPEPLTPNHSNK